MTGSTTEQPSTGRPGGLNMTTAASTVTTSIGANTRAIAAVLFVTGAALVYTVGFAHSDILHNAAHDSRHTLAFPCH